MTNRITLVVGSLIIVLGLGLTASHLIAQVETQTSASDPRALLNAGAAPQAAIGIVGPADVGGRAGSAALKDSRNPNASQVRRSLEVLKTGFQQAKGGEERKAATGAIRTYLVEYFEGDMKTRQAELAAVKRRVDELEKLLTTRLEKKEEIIESQLDTTIREAQGLGFFRANDANPFRSAPGTFTDPDPA